MEDHPSVIAFLGKLIKVFAGLGRVIPVKFQRNITHTRLQQYVLSFRSHGWKGFVGKDHLVLRLLVQVIS